MHSSRANYESISELHLDAPWPLPVLHAYVVYLCHHEHSDCGLEQPISAKNGRRTHRLMRYRANVAVGRSRYGVLNEGPCSAQQIRSNRSAAHFASQAIRIFRPDRCRGRVEFRDAANGLRKPRRALQTVVLRCMCRKRQLRSGLPEPYLSRETNREEKVVVNRAAATCRMCSLIAAATMVNAYRHSACTAVSPWLSTRPSTYPIDAARSVDRVDGQR